MEGVELSQRFSPEELEKFRQQFCELDIDKDGVLSKPEFFDMYYRQMQEKFTDVNVKEDEIHALVDGVFLALDVNHDGVISFEEFMSTQKGSLEKQQEKFEKQLLEQQKMMNVKEDFTGSPYTPYTYPFENNQNVNMIKASGSFKFQPSFSVKEEKEDGEENFSSFVVGTVKDEELEIIAKKKINANLVRFSQPLTTKSPKFDINQQIYRYQNVVFVSIHGHIIAFDFSDFKKASSNDSIIWCTKLFKNTMGNEMVTICFEPLLNILFVSHNKKLFCLDADTGNIQWQNKTMYHHHQYLLSTPNGMCSVGYGHFQIFDKATGKEKTHLKLGTTLFAKQQSSIIADDTFIYVANSSGITKIEEKSGKMIYSKKPKGMKTTLPHIIVYDKETLIAASNGHIYVIDSEKCTIKRDTKIVKSFLHFSKGVAMILRNKDMLIFTHGNKVCAMHPLTHEMFWKTKGFNSFYPVTHTKNGGYIPYGQEQNSLAQDGKRIFIGGGSCVKAIDPVNGKQIWKANLPYAPRMFVSMIVNEEKKILFCGCRGFFFALDTENGRIFFANKLKGFGRGHVGLTHLSFHANNMDFNAQPWLQGNWKEAGGTVYLGVPAKIYK